MSHASIQFSDRGSDYQPEEAQIYQDTSYASSFISIGAGDRYSLLPLSRERREIRLMQLLPSVVEDGPIDCKLYVVSRNDGPIYTALSYAWGNHADIAPIKVNGVDWFVSESLHSALKHLRKQEDPVTLWADAICIDQKNNDEKSWHVQQMRETFAEAADVVAWLGPGTEAEIRAMRALERIGEVILTIAPANDFWGDTTHDKVLALFDKVANDPDLENPVESVFHAILNNDPQNGGFIEPETYQIFGRTWWKRLWVVQELSVSSIVRFYCGHSSIPADSMIAAALIYYQYKTSVWSTRRDAPQQPKVQKRLIEFVSGGQDFVSDANCIYAQCTTRWAYCNRIKEPTGLPLAFVISSIFAYGKTRVLRATDNRDYVFSLLGLASDTPRLGLAADYTCSSADTFTNFSRTLIQCGNYLPLSWCRTRAARRLHGLPTWVADLSNEIKRPFQWFVFDVDTRKYCMEPTYGAGLGLPAHGLHKSLSLAPAIHSSPNTLHLSGIHFDVVSYTGTSFDEIHQHSIPDANVVTHTCIRFLRELKDLLDYSPTQAAYTAADARATAVWCTSIIDVAMSPTWQKKRAGGQISEAQLDLYEKSFPYKEMLEKATSLSSIFSVMDATNLNRRPFVTAKGHLGLGPEEVLPGDLVIVFSGVEMPIICRKGNEGTVHLVGDSYVHGIMDGELTGGEYDVQDFYLH